MAKESVSMGMGRATRESGKTISLMGMGMRSMRTGLLSEALFKMGSSRGEESLCGRMARLILGS